MFPIRAVVNRGVTAPSPRPTLVVLGASSDQRFLIRTAREMGLAVLACDRNPDSPGFADADEHAVVSTRDVRALCAHLDRRRSEGVRIEGVITMGSDIPDVVQAVAAHLGTPAIPEEAARLATDKLAMKERFRERGVPIPWFAEIASSRELASLLAERGPELVIKPVDRSGSRGVFLVDRSCDLPELFTRARDFSYSGRVMVEEYLRGPQISTETVLRGDDAVTPGFADRNYHLLERFRPQIMENGGWVPSRLSADERAEVERVVVQASRALGVERGVTKGDVVLTPAGPKVIEIAARLSGGDFCESLVPLGTGVNYVRAAIALAIGEEPELEALAPRFERHVANRYLFPGPGRLVAVEGVEELRSKEWIHKLELWYSPGDEVPPGLSHAHRFGVFVASAPDRKTLEERVAWAYATLVVRTEPVLARSA